MSRGLSLATVYTEPDHAATIVATGSDLGGSDSAPAATHGAKTTAVAPVIHSPLAQLRSPARPHARPSSVDQPAAFVISTSLDTVRQFRKVLTVASVVSK